MRIAIPKIGFLLVMFCGTMAITQTPAPSGSQSTGAPGSLKYFSKDEVMTSFGKGGTLVTESNYRVMTAHRTESGNVEVHRSYTDVFYIVQGSTNIVIGGKVIGQKDTNPDEPRGDSIEGGETRKLSAGDVMVIPAGVPHWMKDVEGTLLYFVVKVKKE
ncbi:MAG TPA: cupin domain-containing protein [Terriglobales bacterium]|nr:cupin domain-containing protein [Terriglobales bacterium]